MASRSVTTRAIAHIDELTDVVKPSRYLVDGFDCVREPRGYLLKRCLDKREPLSDADEPEDHVIQKNALIAFIAMDFYGHIPVDHSKEHMGTIALDLGWHSLEHLRRVLDYYAAKRLAYLGKAESRYIPVSASTLSRKLCHFVDQYRLCRAEPGPMTKSRRKEFDKMRQVWRKAYKEKPRAFLEGNLELPVVLKCQVLEDQRRNTAVACATPVALKSNKPMHEGVTTPQATEESLLRKELASALQTSPEAPLNRRSSPLPFHTQIPRALAHNETAQLAHDGTTPAVSHAATATLLHDSYRPAPDFVHPSRRIYLKQPKSTGKAEKHGKDPQQPPPSDRVHPSPQIRLKVGANAKHQESQHAASQSTSKNKPKPLPKIKEEPRDGQNAHKSSTPGNSVGRQGKSSVRQTFYSAELDNVRTDQEAVATLLARFERRSISYEVSKGLPPVLLQSVKRLVGHQKKVQQELNYLRNRLAAQR